MPTPDEQKKLDAMGLHFGEQMRVQLGHRWALSVLLTAMTHVIRKILENGKLTHDELFDRIDNSVKTWKLAFTNMDTVPAISEEGDGAVVVKMPKPKKPKLH